MVDVQRVLPVAGGTHWPQFISSDFEGSKAEDFSHAMWLASCTWFSSVVCVELERFFVLADYGSQYFCFPNKLRAKSESGGLCPSVVSPKQQDKVCKIRVSSGVFSRSMRSKWISCHSTVELPALTWTRFEIRVIVLCAVLSSAVWDFLNKPFKHLVLSGL